MSWSDDEQIFDPYKIWLLQELSHVRSLAYLKQICFTLLMCLSMIFLTGCDEMDYQSTF
jgi:hypothetical protein